MGARDRFSPNPAAPAAGSAREYAFSAKDFERVRRLIHRYAGISLGDQKHSMVYSRLSRRLRLHGMGTFAEYLDRLEADARFAADEQQEFVNALTTNLTSFFREAHHFLVLAEFLRSRSAKAPARIWCAACASGEEPYSVAMTMSEAADTGPAGSLLATDIDTRVLATASRAMYRLEAAQACGEERLRRFFLRGAGANKGLVRVRPELMQLIRFATLNLLDAQWPLVREFAPELDVVFCRNVMIYFDRKTQEKILHRIAQLLRPGGLLFVGHSENFSDCSGLLASQGKTVYRRR